MSEEVVITKVNFERQDRTGTELATYVGTVYYSDGSELKSPRFGELVDVVEWVKDRGVDGEDSKED